MSEPPGVERILFLIATYFGTGKARIAPGTFGTLAAIPLALLLNWLGPFYAMGFVLLFLPVAIWAADLYQKQKGVEDPQDIVIDEVFGFLLAMTWLPITWQAYLIGFCLFRALDITKPFPIGYLERRVPGGLGVMIDDLFAGLIVNIVLQVMYTKTTWLGAQIL